MRVSDLTMAARRTTPADAEFRDKYVEFEKDISFDVRGSSGDPESDLLQQLDDQLADVFREFRPKDWVQIAFHGGDMIQPGSLAVDHFHQLNLSDIVSYLSSMEQSQRLNLSSDTITVTVKFIHNPTGTGRIRDMESAGDVLDYVSKLKSCVDIKTKDNNCFARACVYLLYLNECGEGPVVNNRKVLLTTQKAALKSFASHQKSHARVLHDQERWRAKESLDSLLSSFLRDCGLQSGQPVSADDFTRIAVVLSTPRSWKKHNWRLVIASANKRLIFRSSCVTDRTLTLLYTEPGHFLAVTDCQAFFANATDPALRLGPDFCAACDLFVSRSKHECPHTCPHCKTFGMNPVCHVDDPIACRLCRQEFPSNICYVSHQNNGVCTTKVCCKRCKRVRRSGEKHICNTRVCFTCRVQYTNGGCHQCFVTGMDQRKLAKKDEKTALFIFFDTETAQLPRVRPDGKHVDFHQPVMVHARVVCNKCWRGTEQESADNDIECAFCGRHNKLFSKEDPMGDFADFLVRDLDAQFVDRRSHPRDILVMSHNGKRFDTQLLLSAVCERGYEVSNLVTNGLSVLQARIGHRMKLIDSLAFLMLPLSQLPVAYSLPLRKKVFPHRATARALLEGWDGRWPTLHDFYHERLTPKDQKALELWYADQDRSQPFNFWQVMESYIRDDVTVLMLAVMQFRHEYMDLIGTDPFTRNITLAGCVMEGLRVTELPVGVPEDLKGLPVNPYCGYDIKQKVSMRSRIWLLYMREKYFPRMLFEYPENGLVYDGYDRESSTIFEYDGCLFHGCEMCFKRGSKAEETSGSKVINFKERALRHKLKLKRLEATGKRLISIWDHDYDHFLKTDPSFAAHEKKVKDSVRAVLQAPDTDIREALFGGRVEAIRLQAEAGRGRILFKDLISLYPAMLVKREFAAGHPTFIYKDFDYSLPYFGLVLCTVSPPKQALIGSLPYRHGGKLCFPLCRSCVEQENEKTCTHTQEQRQLRSLWTSFELKHAIEKGYSLDQIHVVLHVDKKMTGKSNPLARYTLRLLGRKIKNSGRGGRSDEQLQQFLFELKEMYDIELEPEEIVDNPSARQVAKLSLNCLWGKLGVRSDRTNTKIVNSFEELIDLLTDQTVVIEDTMILGTKIRVTYKSKSQFIKTPSCSSLMNAVFTTAWGRLELKKYMDLLGERLCYCDSDSIIYILGEGEEDPIPTGDHLGDMASELSKFGEGARIEEFYSGGSKCYCMRIVKADGSEDFVVKMKGIRPNADTYKKLTFFTMRAAIRKRCNNVGQRTELLDMRKVAEARKEHSNNPEYDEIIAEIDSALSSIDRKITVDQFRIVPTKYLELHSIIMKKDWRVVYDTRRLLPGGRSVPRGYIDDVAVDSVIPHADDMSEEIPRCQLTDIYQWHQFQWEQMEEGRPLSKGTVCQLLALIQARNTQHKTCDSKVLADVNQLPNNFAILNHNLVFIPHLEDGFNWTLFVFDRLQMTITNFDPVQKQTSSALRDICYRMNEGCRTYTARRPIVRNAEQGSLHRLVQIDWDDSRNFIPAQEENLESLGWDRMYATVWQHDLPHSNRLGDSGIFVILYADFLSRGLSPKMVTPIVVSEFRKNMKETRPQFEENTIIFPSPGRSFTVRLPDKV